MLTPTSEDDTLPEENDKENETPRYNARMTAPDRDHFRPNIGLFYVTQAAGTTKAKATKGAKPKKETKA
jgi:hypothetical protein